MQETKIFVVKTKALMETTYNIEAYNEQEAIKIATENTADVVDQTVIGDVEILSID